MDERLRVLTWNVLYRERPARIDALCSRIRAVGPDVLMLQESSPAHAAEVAAVTGLSVVVVPDVPSTDATSVPALLSRLPLDDLRVIRLPSPSGDHGDARFAVSAVLQRESGRIRLCSTHLSHTDQAGRLALEPAYREAGRLVAGGADRDPAAGLPAALRGSVAARLAQIVTIDDDLLVPTPSATAAILCGDLNCLPDGPEHATLIRRGWVDAWRAGPRLGSGATILDRNPLLADGSGGYAGLLRGTQPGAAPTPDYTLDFHLVRGPVQVDGAWTVGEPEASGAGWPSDHLGIVVDYRV